MQAQKEDNVFSLYCQTILRLSRKFFASSSSSAVAKPARLSELFMTLSLAPSVENDRN